MDNHSECSDQNIQANSCFSIQVNQQRQKLHELQNLIDNLGSGQETVSDKAFEDRLKEAEKAIMELLEEAQTSKGKSGPTSGLFRTSTGLFTNLCHPADVDRGLLDRLNNINNTLTTQWNRLQNIRNTVDNTSSQADRARNRVRDAESLIDRARQELDKAKDAVSKVVSPVTMVTPTDCVKRA